MPNKRHLLILLACLPTLLACTFSSDDVIIDETAGEDYRLHDFYIDEYGNEGVVGFVSGRKYIIVISADEAYLPWGPMADNVCPTDSVTYGMVVNPAFGLAMQQTMKQRGVERYPAQAWCDQKNGGDPYPSGSSWRLPSRYELGLIFGGIQVSSTTNITLSDLNTALTNIGGTTVSRSNTYWTCQEDYDVYDELEGGGGDFDRENRALYVSVTNTVDADKDTWVKKGRHHVRAIKYIYYHE